MSLAPKAALALIGGLSDPTKMPGRGYSIPARDCITGSRLRDQPGTVCSGCYALGGHYAFPTVQRALEKRRDSLTDPSWVEAMAVAIRHSEQSGYFRWHDSGDLQSVDHLANIVKVCHLTPDVSHYLPTREYAIVKAWYTLGGRREDGTYRRQLPENLVVRLSVHMVDGRSEGLLSLARSLDPQLKVSVVLTGEKIVSDAAAQSVSARPRVYGPMPVLRGGGAGVGAGRERLLTAPSEDARGSWDRQDVGTQEGLSVLLYPPVVDSFICPASHQGNQCRSCRACWRTNQEVIGYPLHRPRFMIKAKEKVRV